MLKKIIVTDIHAPIMVNSHRGRKLNMINRPSYGLSFCINGQITYTHRGKQYVSNPNVAVLLPKGESYSLYGDKNGIFPVINFDCIGLECTDIVVFPLQNPELFYKECRTLIELFLFPDKQLDIYITFYGILKHIAGEQSPQNHALQQALTYIEDHIADPKLSNSVIAYNAHISEVYLRKLFSENYHTSPKQYILDIRMQKAKQLLTDSSLSVASISELCGFSSVYTFSRCFKEKTGMSPMEYAKENRVYRI